MRRGEIRWGSPPLPGTVRKRRPFLVVSDDVFSLNERYEKLLVVHLSTARRAAGPYDWEVELPRGAAGLPRSSLVKCNEIYTLFKTQLAERLGVLSIAQMRSVDRALGVALGLHAIVARAEKG